jgi:hypothetical protein
LANWPPDLPHIRQQAARHGLARRFFPFFRVQGPVAVGNRLVFKNQGRLKELSQR